MYNNSRISNKGGRGLNDSKFTSHSFVLVFTIAAAIFLFFAVKLVDLADHSAANDYYPIEGTPYAIRYSSLKTSGIYRGDRNTGTLMLEGLYGFDWGCVAEGDWLYLNEYSRSNLGLLYCRVVRVNTKGFTKEVLLDNAILRGRCASGELVCLKNCLMPSVFPKTNALCALYAVTDPALRPGADGADVVFLDPTSAEALYTVHDDAVFESGFDARYLARTLGEVRG